VVVWGVKTWDSVPEARPGVVVPLVDGEGELAAAFLARNLARRAAGSLSISTRKQGKGKGGRFVLFVPLWWGSYDFLKKVDTTRDSWDRCLLAAVEPGVPFCDRKRSERHDPAELSD